MPPAVDYYKARRWSALHRIGYGLRALDRRVFAQIPAEEERDLATGYQELLEMEGWQHTRFTSTSTKSDRLRDWARRPITSVRSAVPTS